MLMYVPIVYGFLPEINVFVFVLHRQNKHWLYIYLHTIYSQYLFIVKQVQLVTHVTTADGKNHCRATLWLTKNAFYLPSVVLVSFFNMFMSLQYLCYSILNILKCP